MAVRSAQVTVDTSADKLAGAVAGDTDMGGSFVIRNDGATDVYVGPAGVTSATGLRLQQNQSVSGDLDPGDVVYGITAAGSTTVHVFETRTQTKKP